MENVDLNVCGWRYWRTAKGTDVLKEFISVERFIPFTEAVVCVFDQYGERNRLTHVYYG